MPLGDTGKVKITWIKIINTQPALGGGITKYVFFLGNDDDSGTRRGYFELSTATTCLDVVRLIVESMASPNNAAVKITYTEGSNVLKYKSDDSFQPGTISNADPIPADPIAHFNASDIVRAP